MNKQYWYINAESDRCTKTKLYTLRSSLRRENRGWWRCKVQWLWPTVWQIWPKRSHWSYQLTRVTTYSQQTSRNSLIILWDIHLNHQIRALCMCLPTGQVLVFFLLITNHFQRTQRLDFLALNNDSLEHDLQQCYAFNSLL